MTPGGGEISRPGRVLLWMGVLLSGMCAAAVIGWGLTGASAWRTAHQAGRATGKPVDSQGLLQAATADRLEASILPGASLDVLQEKLSGLEPFTHFSIPVTSVGITLLWLWSVMGLGAWFARLLPSPSPPLERLVFAFACGFVVLGLAVLGAGLAGLARPWALGTLLVLTAASGIPRGRELLAWVREAGSPFRRPLKLNLAPNALSAFLLLLAGATVCVALTPPSQSDGLRYHLGALQEWLKAGRIGYLPWNAFSQFPFLPEMHYFFGMAGGAPEASQLMHLATALFAAGAVAAFIQRFVDGLDPVECSSGVASPALLAAGIYLATPAAMTVAGWPFIDHSVTLFFFLALYALLLAIRWSSPGTWILSGLMAGGALGTKYTALPHVTFLAGLGLLHWIVYSPPASVRSSRTITPRYLVIAVLVALGTGGVWYAKSFILAGNPVYPLANSVFRGGDWTEQSAGLYKRKTEEKGTEKRLPDLFRSPVRATFQWHRYEGHYLGPMLLVILVAGLTGTAASMLRHGPAARPLVYTALTAAVYYGMWFFSYQSNRMLLPFLALALPPAAAMLRECAAASARLRVTANLVFGLCIVYGGLWTLQWQYVRAPYPPVLRFVLGDLSQEEYLVRAVPQVRAFRELSKRVQPGEKVLFVGEHRILYAPFPAVWSDWFDTPAVLGILRESGASNAEELMAALRRRHIRWIFVNEHELGLGRPSQLEVYFRPRFTEKEWNIVKDLLDRPGLERRTLPPGFTLLRIPDGETGR